MTRAMPGRAKWACRQSRQGAPGKKLSSCISLTDRHPPRRWRRDHGSGGPKRQRYVSFTNPSTTRPGQVGRRARRQAGAKGKKDKSQARASEQAGAKAKAQDPKGPQTQKSPKPKSKPPKSPPLKKQVSENLKPKSPPKRQKHRLQYPPNL
ncbi:PREDICTED: serine/arginine repetitive matrix protein 1-like [Corvus brachyrhynchos]|uniref:serine/arginine repetitive matrix protein 1-like n=1 Tax=Corvus brachyrhynchos TaxID=85066 RepID=UPI0008166789|nr:PREDICTED: serine/arginine repetitive matrix protein 1-like [Corvus brachyrhynchos]